MTESWPPPSWPPPSWPPPSGPAQGTPPSGGSVPGGPAQWGQPPTPTTCYRHPGRNAGVTCRRCSRPICPECMIQADVGWECPECLRRTARSGRGNRAGRANPFGRAPSSGRYRFNSPAATGSLLTRAPVTMLLIAVNVVVFIISKGGATSFIDKWGEVPGEIQYLGKTYQLFTAPWVHLSVEHIGLNMLSLLIVGPLVEAGIGKVRYLLLYLASAMGGSVAYFLIAPPRTAGVGASGAIFGVFGALFVVSRSRGMETGGIIGLIVVNLIFGFVEPNIGWQAHVGGLVIGAAVAAGFLLAERWRGRSARLVEAATLAIAALVMLGLMQFPCRHIPGI